MVSVRKTLEKIAIPETKKIFKDTVPLYDTRVVDYGSHQKQLKKIKETHNRTKKLLRIVEKLYEKSKKVDNKIKKDITKK